MPIPSPDGKKKNDYISDCMGDDAMNSEFPDSKQRAAVCYSKYKQSKKKSKGSEIFWWSDGDVDDNFIIY